MNPGIGLYILVRSIPGAIRRVWLTFVLAVVLSAIEVERTVRYVEPSPVVMMLHSTPGDLLRIRPFRPRYRFPRERR